MALQDTFLSRRECVEAGVVLPSVVIVVIWRAHDKIVIVRSGAKAVTQHFLTLDES